MLNLYNLKKKQSEKSTNEENPFEHLSDILKSPTPMDKEKNHIYFYTEVDQYSCLELNRKINDLNKELMQFAIQYEVEPPNIYLHINSFGGSLFAAFATIDTIMNSKIPVISIIEGCAASAATIISMVCHKRYCTPNSFMLIHQLSTGASGKYEELKDDFLNDTKLMELLYKLYLEHTTMDIKTIKKVLKRDRWWDANECLNNGLIDELWNGCNINIGVNKEFGSENFCTKRVSAERNKRKASDISKEDLKLSESDSESDSDNSKSKQKPTKPNKSTNDNKTKKRRRSKRD